MAEITFKRSMNIGTISAENDKEFLENCFIESPEYDEIRDFNNKNMILLGRTGSGKTALLNKIKDNENTKNYFVWLKSSFLLNKKN